LQARDPIEITRPLGDRSPKLGQPPGWTVYVKQLGSRSGRDFRSGFGWSFGWSFHWSFLDHLHCTRAVAAPTVTGTAVAAATAVAAVAAMAAVSTQASEQTAVATTTTMASATVTRATTVTTAGLTNDFAGARAAAAAVTHTPTTTTTVAAVPGQQTTVATVLGEQATTAATAVTTPTRAGITRIARQGNGQRCKENGDSSDNRAIHLSFLPVKQASSTYRRNVYHSNRLRRCPIGGERTN
jgi:hypothetical protein